MEFSIEKETLLAGLSKIQNIAEKKSTVPSLSYVLLENKGNFLSLTATDLEVGIKIELPAFLKNEGEMALPAKKLYEIIREFPEKEISFKLLDNNQTQISCETSIFSLATLDTAQFPRFPKIEKNIFFPISAFLLKKMIDRTHFAMSMDENKYNLNGIFFHLTQENNLTFLNLASTDSHRLASTKEEVNFPSNIILDKGTILPRKGIMELRKLIENFEGEIEIGFSDKNAIFLKEKVILIVRLIDGEFPDYQKVVPEVSEKFAIISQDSFLRVLKRVSTLTTEKFRGIRLTFKPEKLEIHVNNPEFGEGKESLSIQYNGEEESIAYNSKYLIDVITAFQNQYIRFQFKDNSSPGVINPTDHSNSKAVIMPMRL